MVDLEKDIKEAYEVEKVGLGRKFGTNCDLAVVYTKTKK